MEEVLEHDRKHAAGQGPKHGIACDPLADGPADAVGGGVGDGGGRGSGAEELGTVELEPDDRDAIVLITVMAVKESTMRTRAQAAADPGIILGAAEQHCCSILSLSPPTL